MSQRDGVDVDLSGFGEDVEIHDNSSPDAVFVTSKAKIELALRKYKQGVLAKQAWVNPFVILVTVASTLQVTTFTSFLGLSGTTWKGAFVLMMVISAAWLINSVRKYITNKDKSKFEYVMDELRVD